MTIELKPVKSSNIEAIGYDYERAELQVQFTGGALYAYDVVLPDKYEGLMGAKSHGKYLNEQIKGKHTFRKLKREGVMSKIELTELEVRLLRDAVRFYWGNAAMLPQEHKDAIRAIDRKLKDDKDDGA
jgi:KTSC domain